MITLTMTESEADYLADILSMWIEGHDEAQDMTISDPMFETAEQLLEATDGLKTQKEGARSILRRLKEATFSG
jgi:hypothetical protein